VQEHKLFYTLSGLFHGIIYITPSTVSFNQLYFTEGTCLSTASGLFGYENNIPHPPTGAYVAVGNGNSTNGSRVGTNNQVFDTVGSGGIRLDTTMPTHNNLYYPNPTLATAPPDPQYVGSFTWPIPWYYSTDGTNKSGTITTATHYMTSDQDGNFQVSKAGSGLVKMKFTDPTSSLQVATPTFNPAAGTYTGTQTVTIASATTPGTTIKYTTDGTVPSPTHGTLYTGPITINATTTLNAIAYFTTGVTNNSNVATASYTINIP
jgi:hypothetical protein